MALTLRDYMSLGHKIPCLKQPREGRAHFGSRLWGTVRHDGAVKTAAGCSAPAVRKKREMHVGAHWLSPLFTV